MVPEEETVMEVEVVDMKGVVVRHETGTFTNHTVKALPVAGLYMIKVVCKSGKVYQSRLVVD